MFVIVEGVAIKLLPQQLALIYKAREKAKKKENRLFRIRHKEHIAERKAFMDVLKKYGFKKINTKDWADKTAVAYIHEGNDWYAELLHRGGYSDVWMVGKGLKQASGFPGGWLYEEPAQIEAVIIKALNDTM